MNKLKSYESIFENKDKALLQNHIAVPSGEARAQFARVMDFARNEDTDVVITDHGRPIAAVIPISDLKLLDWLKKNNNREDIFRLMEKGEFRLSEKNDVPLMSVEAQKSEDVD